MIFYSQRTERSGPRGYPCLASGTRINRRTAPATAKRAKLGPIPTSPREEGTWRRDAPIPQGVRLGRDWSINPAARIDSESIGAFRRARPAVTDRR